MIKTYIVDVNVTLPWTLNAIYIYKRLGIYIYKYRHCQQPIATNLRSCSFPVLQMKGGGFAMGTNDCLAYL